ncbi:hypothetical protein BDW74DRAFT_181249 [Aspergillus multicolor]|uniref:uncharacterized protein n=1 Tax=Aspergillus multicolor TaxID=41759 RepID=UPI003CCE4576
MQFKPLTLVLALLASSVPVLSAQADLQTISDLSHELRATLENVQSSVDAYNGGVVGLRSLGAAISRTRPTVGKCEDVVNTSPPLTAEESAAAANSTAVLTPLFTEMLNAMSVKVPLIRATGLQGRAKAVFQPAYEQDMRYLGALEGKLHPRDAAAVHPALETARDAYEALFRAFQ